MIYFSSDWHLFQKNIVSSISNWKTDKQLRDFKDQYEMSRHIIDMANQTVSKDDTLYLLGDFDFSNHRKTIIESAKQVNCKVVFLYGNHDHELKKCIQHTPFEEAGYYLELTHKFPLPDQNPYREKWKGSQKIVMSHYAMRVWNQSHRGSWMLYGHSHDSLDNPDYQETADQVKTFKVYDKAKTMDVGVDSAFRILGEYRPFSFDEIKEIMDKKDLIKVDHH